MSIVRIFLLADNSFWGADFLLWGIIRNTEQICAGSKERKRSNDLLQ